MRALIAAQQPAAGAGAGAGAAGTAFAGALMPSTLPHVAEEDDDALVSAAEAAAKAEAQAASKERLAQQAGKAAEQATKAAAAANAAAEQAAALVSPGGGVNGSSVPAALALGEEQRTAPMPVMRKGADRDSDSMSVELNSIPVGLG